MTTHRGLTAIERRMLKDEQRELRARLSAPREPWMDILTLAADRAAIRERLAEIDQELTA